MAKAPKQLIPLLNRVLIKRADPVTQSKSGVLIPKSQKAQITKGTVVAVGPGTTTSQGKSVPCCLKVGDTVLLPDYGGTKIPSEDKQEYFLYREYDILAKINE
ncbi:Cpn10 domain containing protein [Asbolus verrucosus]|uniref:10 kDa heat shock protein, mitochondrial n=1 Tax=Asbolus verrucosus TaxID=1661398 RepID=A0A482VDM5_ASBVE|nr:Cpn10 domain containing protein [Asbolus verrucosus]